MKHLEDRVDKVEDVLKDIAITNAKTGVTLNNVVEILKEMKESKAAIATMHTDIEILKHNWKWVKGVLALFALPLAWLLLRAYMS